MQRALLFTNSILGAGIRSVLEGIPDWSVTLSSTQIPGEIVDLAQQEAPVVTIFDMTCLRVLDLFQLLGKEQVRLFGTIITATQSGLDEESLFFQIMWGVAAHISGWTEPGELADLLRRVARGEYLLTSDCLGEACTPAPPLSEAKASEGRVISPIDEPPAPQETLALLSPFTPREAEVLCFIAQGMTNKEIARALAIRENTVKNYITAIFQKLQVYDRTAAVVYALRRKWIHMPEVPPTRVLGAAVA